ncbi:MAG: efflux RND transporter periplasmic adaptor subunit [Pirellulaceae bacterium]
MRFNKISGATLLVLYYGLTGLVFGQAANDDERSDLDRRIGSTVREAGEIQSSSHIEIRSMVQGETTLLHVVAEGTLVQEGDFLAELDSSTIERKIEQQKIEVARAAANLIKAELEYESAFTARQRIKEVALLFAESAALERATLLEDGGELEMELKDAEGEKQLFETRLRVSQAHAAMWREQHPDQELDPAIVLALTEAENGITRLSRRIVFLQGKHREQAIARLNLELARQRHELEQNQAEAESLVVGAAAEVETVKLAHHLALEGMASLDSDLDNCQILSPANGTVVYAREFDRRGGGEWIPEPGATVRERQPFILLTDFSQLHVKTLVNESRIAMIREGQSAQVHLDALPDEVISGTVTKVNNYPEPTGWMNSESVRQYAVTVAIEHPPAFARIGMNAMVEIEIGDVTQGSGQTNRRFAPGNDATMRGENPSDDEPRPGGLTASGMAKRTLDRFDTNKDGFIDQDEIEAAPGNVRDQLRQADSNGDEKLDEAELEAALASMMRRFRDR